MEMMMPKKPAAQPCEGLMVSNQKLSQSRLSQKMFERKASLSQPSSKQVIQIESSTVTDPATVCQSQPEVKPSQSNLQVNSPAEAIKAKVAVSYSSPAGHQFLGGPPQKVNSTKMAPLPTSQDFDQYEKLFNQNVDNEALVDKQQLLETL